MRSEARSFLEAYASRGYQKKMRNRIVTNFLGRIVESKKARLGRQKQEVPLTALKAQIGGTRFLLRILSNSDGDCALTPHFLTSLKIPPSSLTTRMGPFFLLFLTTSLI